MKLTRMRLVLAASGLIASGTVAGTILAAAPASAMPSLSAPIVLINYCGDHGTVQPATEDLPGCMPSNEYLAGLRWTSWKSVAYGRGQFRVNNCTPSSSCGPSQFTRYPILTVLWRAEPWPGHAGRDFFSRLTVIFTGAHHPHGPAAQTLILPAH
jgi:hypothetical protein